MTTGTVDKAGAVGDMAGTSTAPLGGELVRRRCNTCGAPLTDEGLVALAELDDASDDLGHVRALRDERADLEQRLARAKDELKRATRLKDEQARVRVARTVEGRQAQLDEVDRILAETKLPKPPADGPCPSCKTVFRGGRVDQATAAKTAKERTERQSQLAALRAYPERSGRDPRSDPERPR